MRVRLREIVASTDGFFLENAGPVWAASGLEKLFDFAEQYGLVILGCDILTLSGAYTYDNWYFPSILNKPLLLCSAESIRAFKVYIEDYISRHGDHFLFGVVIHDAY